MRPIATDSVAWSVGLSVCLSVTTVSPAKAAEPQCRLNQRARRARAQGPEPQGAPKHQPMRYFLSREVVSVSIFTG